MSLDTRLKVRIREDGQFSISDKKIEKIGLKGLTNMIKDGYSLKVVKTLEDNSEIDLTLETLAKVALNGEFGYDKENEKTDIMTGLLSAVSHITDREISEDALYLIIENGGIKTYLLRQAKGMVQL